jgi:hypothetical protein
MKKPKLSKEQKAMRDRLKKINSTVTESLSETQLNQLAKYTYDVLTTGRIGSFRYLIYDILKPSVAYGDGMYLGLLDFNNMLCDLAGRIKLNETKTD